MDSHSTPRSHTQAAAARLGVLQKQMGASEIHPNLTSVGDSAKYQVRHLPAMSFTPPASPLPSGTNETPNETPSLATTSLRSDPSFPALGRSRGRRRHRQRVPDPAHARQAGRTEGHAGG